MAKYEYVDSQKEELLPFGVGCSRSENAGLLGPDVTRDPIEAEFSRSFLDVPGDGKAPEELNLLLR
jgi:hypothetical protein